MTIDISALDIKVLRNLMWEILTEYVDSDSIEINNIIHDVYNAAVAKRLLTRKPNSNHGEFPSTDTSIKLTTEVLWELVRYGILIPAPIIAENGSGLARNLGIYYFTEQGKQIILDDKPIPSDPTGFLAKIKFDVPKIDDVIYTYAEESIYSYNEGRLLSATITIGVAAEKAILLLLEAYTKYLPTENERNSFLKKTSGKFIKNQFDEFRKSFDSHKSNMDKKVTEGTDITINGIFDLLRNSRNDAGHPTGKKLNRESVFILLRFFTTYLKKIYDLIDYFNNKAMNG